MSHDKIMPLVTVIVLNYNGGGLLLKCVRSLLNFTTYPNFEILVVDNGSYDNSVVEVKMILGNSRLVRTVVLERNFGYAEGNNIGYMHVSPKTKYVVFMNNDIEVNEDWLTELVKILEMHQDVGAAQPVILTPGKVREGLFGGYLDVFGYNADKKEREPKPRIPYSECLFAWGATLITRKELVDKFGLFNPQYFLNFEETDFCWRLRLAGYKVAIIPTSTVHHIYSVATKKFFTSAKDPFPLFKKQNLHITC